MLADGLWEKAQKLPEGAHYRYALLIAARNIESHPLPIATDVDARKVKGVGPRIVKELSTMGLKASTSKRDRLFMEGADAVMPAKKHCQTDANQESTSSPEQEHNSAITNALLDLSRKEGQGFSTGMRIAAQNIKHCRMKIETVQQCLSVPGVNVYLAKLIITQILRRALTDDEQAFLAGAELQVQRLFGTRPKLPTPLS